ncbi:MAG: thiamine-phosphate kinase, partial [Nanoarchaeota archaeon]
IELIGRISRKIKLFSKDIAKGIGDDAAVINYDKNYYLLLTTDSLVQNVHFSSFFTPEQIGMKAVEINVSDIAAMGGFPKYALISLIIPKNTKLDFIDKLYDGINEKCRKYKISVIGGNLSDGKEISVTIMMLGFVEKKNLRLRSDAKANDLIAVTENLGASAIGLQLLKAKMKGGSINYHLNPKSKLNAARLLAKYGINAMEDISDGLATEIRNICNESKTGAVIYKEKIPINKNTIIDSKKLNKDPYDFALYGGEDFELVFTMNKNSFKKLEKIKNRVKFTVVGKILPKKDGILLLDKGKKKKLKYGYEHFKGS